ncbi:toxin [Candidatus Roizmanbacteria bacterium CG02_land_8_20_14_3_00_36_15]|uniref:Toxin n=2 Tax=Candidatus Roizmaniibacteriota TaxID=1752723 RepID=A0A2M8F2X0_9BACT|nr:MAG: toxin [Candidatus Roizmanbacteria bacterium CG11_big_fil_rev_8_21_14_0_20_35_14]PIV38310.1 MAG: toxin [Candidatus Roizmanbacteria bacterium CG02_land_8_20_14_3_00_36_15]PJC33626.1 MAG: toxin [Candidatus Roizmanbacteria bacterium CG_4_9_14_0_2_um_filter_36_12]
MKELRFSEVKDKELRKRRGIGFREIVIEIEAERNLIDVIDHPNKKKYPKQRMFLVKINNYIYILPFIEETEFIFLKTVYKSRKYTKKYEKAKKL